MIPRKSVIAIIGITENKKTVYPNLSNLSSLAPNVLVVITFEPDSKYNLCISISLSGFLNPNTSGFSPICNPFC